MPFGIDLTAGGAGFVITTFFIGLLIGTVVKRLFKLAIAIASLVVLLVTTGYVNFNPDLVTKETVYRAFSLAPTIASTTSQVSTLLPITSGVFLVGLAIGVWKG